MMSSLVQMSRQSKLLPIITLTARTSQEVAILDIVRLREPQGANSFEIESALGNNQNGKIFNTIKALVTRKRLWCIPGESRYHLGVPTMTRLALNKVLYDLTQSTQLSDMDYLTTQARLLITGLLKYRIKIQQEATP